MPNYRVNVGFTYFVEAADEDAAEEMAYELAADEIGMAVNIAWMDVEEID